MGNLFLLAMSRKNNCQQGKGDSAMDAKVENEKKSPTQVIVVEPEVEAIRDPALLYGPKKATTKRRPGHSSLAYI